MSTSSTSDAGQWMQQPMPQSYGSDFSIDPSLSNQMPHAQAHSHLQPPPLMRRTSTSSTSSEMSNPFEYGFDLPSDASDLEGFDFGFGGSFGANANGFSNMLPQQMLSMPQHGQRSLSQGAVPTVGTMSIDPNMFRPKERATSLGGAGLAIDPSVLMQGTADDLATAKPKRKGATTSHPVDAALAAKGKGRTVSSTSAATGTASTEDDDEDVAGGRKSSHARKQKPNHIPRPRNAFILFRKHVVDAKLIPASVEIRHQNVSVIVAKMWAEASPEQKEQFNELAKIEKEEHQKK
jgi:HMG box factor